MRAEAPITGLEANAYRIPTDAPEADGTLAWSSTTMVVVHATAAGETGLGYSYTDAATATFIRGTLSELLAGRDAIDIPHLHQVMLREIRNSGRAGLVATAISAVDTALYDLKARILGVALSTLLGSVRDSVPVYGSGGFTSYDDDTLAAQLGGWAEQGFRFVKMKVGSEPGRDIARVSRANDALAGSGTRLFVDANGAYSRKQALAFSESFAALGVEWLEEPVSSDDLAGLRLVRDRAPAGMDIAAGEYGYDQFYFRRMLEAGAVDVLQADVTRCLGYTGLFVADALAASFSIPLSLHCAPALHLPAAHALTQLRHQEWFHDHVRMEHMLLDGAPQPHDGVIAADRNRPGNGLSFKRKDAERFSL